MDAPHGLPPSLTARAATREDVDAITELVGWADVHKTRAEADVRPSHRGRGLSTNSSTGALGLYDKVGMRVRRSYTRRSKTL